MTPTSPHDVARHHVTAPANQAGSIVVGAYLRHLRRRSRILLRTAARVLDVHLATVQRIEWGLVPVSSSRALALLRLYGVNDQPAHQRMVELLGQLSPADGSLVDHCPGVLSRLAAVEEQATAFRLYSLGRIPPSLQTAAYSEGLRWPRISPDPLLEGRPFIQGAVSSRPVEVLLDEALLMRAVGGLDVLAGQLDYLATLAEQGAALVLVVPFTSGVMPPAVNLTSLRLPGPGRRHLTYIESPLSIAYFANHRGHQQALDELRARAWSPADSSSILRRAAATAASGTAPTPESW
ncbi:Scr1 family TA system antitoxin-like transcriptional regulator [Streptomyces sp. NPDC058254]|uniref:Scr1 family TA system antitoxin-like transcriptional regulator n=1 Tax=Streptomyces sp. NPDC058254 TaxID=3346406 RepID=UPI0036F12F5C